MEYSVKLNVPVAFWERVPNLNIFSKENKKKKKLEKEKKKIFKQIWNSITMSAASAV